MDQIVILVLGVIEAGIVLALLHFRVGLSKNAGGSDIGKLKKADEDLKNLSEKFNQHYALMVDVGSAAVKAKELRILKESLKTERGRITITQAELETVEARLRELEEIERELEASGIETKEEMNILSKKQGDLATKNDTLKKQISDSLSKIDGLMSELESNSQISEQVQGMKTDLLGTQEKIDTLLLQIEQGNEQYFILKKRYDALDIEYAQLFEKFSAAEEMMAKESK